MKYATFSLPDEPLPRLGAVTSDAIVDVKRALDGRMTGRCPATLLELIQAGPETWRLVASLLGEHRGNASAFALHDVRLHAPIPRPLKNVFCLGLNYLSHVKESSQARQREARIPSVPVFFTKAPTTVNGPFDQVILDRSVTEQLDWEAELAIVIGVGGKNIGRGAALDHVFGYTVLNDLSARDLQMQHLQWFKGKSLDGCCPMGPSIVTADQFGDPQAKRISLQVNGTSKQDATTADMLFPVDVIIEFLSRGMTLEPGDIIATGTPEGVGLGRTPPEYLKEGDVVETEIEGIGKMRNTIIAVQRANS